MGREFTILSEVLGGGKKQPTDRQMHSAEVKRTAKWQTCGECGATWTDEEDTCQWCHEE